MSFSAPDIRPRRSMALFAMLAILMVIASYVFILLLAAACVYLPLRLVTFGVGGFQAIALSIFGVVVAATMLWSLIPRRDRFVAPGMPLLRPDHPRLFAELDAIAATLHEPPPREVYLIPEANAFVADRGGLMGFGSRRVMGLGLPLFAALTVSQFRAVLAHEFAHYYGGDTSLVPWVYRTRMAMIRIFQNVGSLRQFTRVAIMAAMYLAVAAILKAYFKVFLRAINLISRRQEHRADELACLVAGREPLIAGLRSIHGAAVAWPFFWQTEVAPVLGDGALPAISDGFSRFLLAPQIQHGIQESLQKNLQDAKTNPYDTHPPLRDRISATVEFSHPGPAEDPRPASSLLDRLPELEMHFVENRIAEISPGSLQYVSWEDIGLRVRIPSWQRAVDAHSALLRGLTAASIPDQIPKLPEIASSIPDPKGMLLTREQRTQRAGQFLAVAMSLALVKHRWEVVAQPGIFHLRRGQDQFNPFTLISELMTGKLSRDAWLRHCQDLDISHLPLYPTGQIDLAPAHEIQPTLF